MCLRWECWASKRNGRAGNEIEREYIQVRAQDEDLQSCTERAEIKKMKETAKVTSYQGEEIILGDIRIISSEGQWL